MLADGTRQRAVGVTAVIGGNAQEWLELENAACRYGGAAAAALYSKHPDPVCVDMGNSTARQGTSMASF